MSWLYDLGVGIGSSSWESHRSPCYGHGCAAAAADLGRITRKGTFRRRVWRTARTSRATARKAGDFLPRLVQLARVAVVVVATDTAARLAKTTARRIGETISRSGRVPSTKADALLDEEGGAWRCTSQLPVELVITADKVGLLHPTHATPARRSLSSWQTIPARSKFTELQGFRLAG